eukprot:2927397-Rhodomonas_salina.1
MAGPSAFLPETARWLSRCAALIVLPPPCSRPRGTAGERRLVSSVGRDHRPSTTSTIVANTATFASPQSDSEDCPTFSLNLSSEGISGVLDTGYPGTPGYPVPRGTR